MAPEPLGRVPLPTITAAVTCGALAHYTGAVRSRFATAAAVSRGGRQRSPTTENGRHDAPRGVLKLGVVYSTTAPAVRGEGGPTGPTRRTVHQPSVSAYLVGAETSRMRRLSSRDVRKGGGGRKGRAPPWSFRAPAGRPARAKNSCEGIRNPHRSHEICAEINQKSMSGQSRAL